jgi:hypothetical protein
MVPLWRKRLADEFVAWRHRTRVRFLAAREKFWRKFHGS